VLGEKGAEAVYDSNMRKIKISNELFEAKYIDKGDALHAKLLKYIDDPNNHEEIAKELEKAFQEMRFGHWKGTTEKLLRYGCSFYTDSKYPQITNGEIVFAILLANRGRVEYCKQWSGYKFSVRHQDVVDRERWYEYFEWLQETLNKQGNDLHLIYRHDIKGERLVWEGTSADKDETPSVAWAVRKPFNEDLLKKQIIEIPKPYYEKD